MRYLLDTNIIIPHLAEDPATMALITILARDGIAVSTVTLMEAWQGICALVTLVVGAVVVAGLLDWYVQLPSLIRGALLVGILASAGVVAYRYLFEHRLRGELERYRRMLLWMAWFWRAKGDDELARSALALSWQLSDAQHVVPGHPFTLALATRSLAAVGKNLRPGDRLEEVR